jgi:hypothetical protein
MSNDRCFIDIVNIAMLYNIESTSYLHCKPFFLFTSFTSWTLLCCTISNQHRVNIVNLSSCLHRRHRDVVQYRINIVSTLWTFPLVYIVHIVDIAMLYNIESTLCRHCEPFFLFTSFTSSTSRCCTILNQHRVDIVNLSSCLHCSHRRHRDVVWYWINIVSTLWTFLLVYIAHIVDIAMLYYFESTSCQHCEPFFLFTSSTLRCCTISNQHREPFFLFTLFTS